MLHAFLQENDLNKAGTLEREKEEDDWHEAQSKAWRAENNADLAYRGAYRQAVSGDHVHPPEKIRKIVKEAGDLSSKGFKSEKKLAVGMLKYIPLALYKLLENMPMPWEEAKYVDVVYHVGGVLTIVKDTPTVAEPLYLAQWGSAWNSMRQNKVELELESEGTFQRVVHRGNENEPPLDYGDLLMDRIPPPPLQADLDEEENASIANWFYDPFPRLVLPDQIRGPRRPNGYYFTIEALETLFRHASGILPQLDDKNYFYLWDIKSFYTAKALHVAIPRGPKFEPTEALKAAREEDEEWTQLNDLRRVIHRNDPLRPRFSEVQIAFPYLYGTITKDVRALTVNHYPASSRVENDDPILPCFSYHVSLNMIKRVNRKFAETELHPSKVTLCSARVKASEDAKDELELPSGFEPFLSDLPLETEHTRSALALLYAPEPFNHFEGGMKRRIDVLLCDKWYQEPPDIVAEQVPSDLPSSERDKILRGYTQLLKHNVKRSLQRDKLKMRKAKLESDAMEDEINDGAVRRLDAFSNLKHFETTKMEWLEAALQLMRQGHNMLVQLINVKSLPYVHIDYNFDAKPTRTLTTKQIKRSRLGHAFHMIRELLRFMKRVVDIHVWYRLGHSDSFQLADAIHYLFANVGSETGIYRYKLRAMKQINRASNLSSMLYNKFSVGGALSGPGCGFWGPSWRVWVFFFRGMTPLMQRYLGNLTDRVLFGRTKKGKYEGKRITRQRVETDKDVNIKEAFRRELREMLPEQAKVESIVKTMDQHMNEAFRHWRSGLEIDKPWTIPNLPEPLRLLVKKYVKLRGDEYISVTQLQRQRIADGDTVDKQAFMKNLGRLTRLKIMDEKMRQRRYLTGADDPTVAFDPSRAEEMYRTMANWLSDRGFKKISFPDASKPEELSLLELSLNRLRDQHNIANRLKADQRQEQALIEQAFNSPHDALTRIIKDLSQKRQFKDVDMEYMDNFSHLYPIYKVDPSEKMVDSFLDQYLWFKAMNAQRLFPNWVKPSDSEPAPYLVHKWCDGINNSPDLWDVSNESSVVLMQANFEEAFYENANWVFFRRLLELIMDKSLVDYIVSRHDVTVVFKDMSYHHHQGIIRGFMFSSFLAQFWGLMIDILLVGHQRTLEIAGSAKKPNTFMNFGSDSFLATSHPIRGYCRYRSEVYILLRFSKTEADEVRRRYLKETNTDPEMRAKNGSVAGFKNWKQWPRDGRMRLFLNDVNLARAVLDDFSGRLPAYMGTITEENSLLSVYSKDNPNLLFDMAGFSIRMLPVSRTEEDVLENESMWNLRHRSSKAITCRAFLQVSKDHVTMIRNKARRTVMMVGSSTYHSISAKWNALVTEIVPYYREAILGTGELQDILARAEHRMQARVMMSLNSRAKSRFPPAMFYAPSDLGGLGMLSVGHSLIPAEDRMSKATRTSAQFFLSGLTNIDTEDIPVPNILQYYTSWETEIRESEKAWATFRMKKLEAETAGGRAHPRPLSLDDVEDIIDKGLPRIRVHFSRRAALYWFDSGFRCRMEFQRYQAGKYLKNWWFHPEHDGNICGGVLEKYRADMNLALGGVEAILEHSLFNATGFPSWEGIEFNRSGGFENSKKDNNLAKQQRAGLTKVPNERFALWWSPTINRSKVQAGFQSKIDMTGVFMCGKLETIKKSLIKIFSGHLWEKCHGSVVNDIASKLKDPEVMTALQSTSVRLEQQHPHKSFTFTTSSPDVIMDSARRWPVSPTPSSLSTPQDQLSGQPTQKYFIDVQLRWGNYDSNNIEDYAMEKFNEYSNAIPKVYPFRAGVVVAIDLGFNCHSAYGYWIPGLKPLLSDMLQVIMKNNKTLFILRERMKGHLGLFSSSPTEASLSDTNISELFSKRMKTWIVDESHTYCTSEQPTPDGGKKPRSENGAVLVFEPMSGQLKMSVVHKSVFAGQKRRSKLAREKAAEEIASWLRSTPERDRPAKIIVTRSRFRQTLHNMLVLDYPDIVVGQSDLNLSLPMILNHQRLIDIRIGATESEADRRGREFCLYDDWQFDKNLQLNPVTCFDLLNLILRGYHIHKERTVEILIPDQQVELRKEHFWPTYAMREWKDISRKLQEMIIANAALRMKVSPTDFTQQEKAGILLGKKITSVAIQMEEAKEIESMRRAPPPPSESSKLGAVQGAEKQRNRAIVVEASKPSMEKWRGQCLSHSSYVNEKTTITFENTHATSISSVVDFPEELIKKALGACNADVPCCSYLFGHALADAIQIVAILVPPQAGSVSEVASVLPLDAAPLSTNHLELLGTLRVGKCDTKLTSHDLALQGRVLETNDGLKDRNLVAAIMAVTEDEVLVRCYLSTSEGVSWAKGKWSEQFQKTPEPLSADRKYYTPCRGTINAARCGFFLTPLDGVWNYTLDRPLLEKNAQFDVVVDTPLPFFHSLHRRDHFFHFVGQTTVEDEVDQMDSTELWDE